MKMTFMLPLLLVSAVAISPAQANWFSNPQQGISRNIGSAPNPRPEDIRNDARPIAAQDVNSPTSMGIFIGSDNPAAPKASTPDQAPQPADAGGAKNTADASPSR